MNYVGIVLPMPRRLLGMGRPTFNGTTTDAKIIWSLG